ncbi:hypothetical protein X975_06081, partial [Stegodyphus mimosarum]
MNPPTSDFSRAHSFMKSHTSLLCYILIGTKNEEKRG